jgi:hypothetical protein
MTAPLRFRRGRATALALACTCLSACSTIVPEGFVTVPSQRGRDVEALSADGAIYTATWHPSPDEATLGFWSVATKRELVERRGYELLGEQSVRGASGAVGNEIWLKTPPALGDQRYLLTLFLEERWGENRLHVTEAAGPAELLEPRLAAIRTAIRASY